MLKKPQGDWTILGSDNYEIEAFGCMVPTLKNDVIEIVNLMVGAHAKKWSNNCGTQ
jgi:hypothetical protein